MQKSVYGDLLKPIAKGSFADVNNAIQAITFDVRDSQGVKIGRWSDPVKNQDLASMGVPDTLSGPEMTLQMYPQEIHRSQPNKVDVHPLVTYSDNLEPLAYVDTWGASTPQWTIRGHTGYAVRTVRKGTTDYHISGYSAYVLLHNFFACYAKENVYRLKQGTEPVHLLFYNWADFFQDYWYVEPLELPSKRRDSMRPLIYQYDLTFVGIKPFVTGEKPDDSIADSISNFNERAMYAAKTMYNSNNDFMGMRGIIPGSLLNQFGSVTGNISSFANSILTSGNYSALIGAPSLLGQVTNFSASCKSSILGPLSPLYPAINTLKQISCGIETLMALPLSIYGNLQSDVQAIINAVFQSGCGTTLRTSNLRSTHDYATVLGR